MEGLSTLPESQQRRLLRRAVQEHIRAEPRRVHPPVVHVGVPGGPEAVYADIADQPTDHALRTDIVGAMLRRTRGGSTTPLVWLTRTGPLELQDVDVRWLASARAAYAEAGVGLVMVVVNRRGWWDPRSGATRQWVRLRS